jgi:hypothetical protein
MSLIVMKVINMEEINIWYTLVYCRNALLYILRDLSSMEDWPSFASISDKLHPCIKSDGSKTFPTDLDIFLPSASTTYICISIHLLERRLSISYLSPRLDWIGLND